MRVIDNFKRYGLNDACELPEEFTLDGVDFIAAFLIRALVLNQKSNTVALKGKMFGLKAAYNNIPSTLQPGSTSG